VLRDGDLTWTSVHVALVKSPSTAAQWRRRSPGPVGRPRGTRMPKLPIRQRAANWAYSRLMRWRA
jgi:hypothetical protein